jgi:nucleotide-binding universal stress UspA family protein
VHTRVPYKPDLDPSSLICASEHVAFLEATGLDRSRPGADFRTTAAGQYTRLEAEVEAYRQRRQAEIGQEMTFEAAAQGWYDEWYLPVAQAIWERGLLRDRPDRTVADLYLWIADHWQELQDRLEVGLEPSQAVAALAAEQAADEGLLRTVLPDDLKPGPPTGRWREERTAARYLDRLFRDVLVPLSGSPESWKALDQALTIARMESSRLLGLHLGGGPEAEAVVAEFNRRCAEAGVEGRCLAEPETENIAGTICARAAMADLVVLHLAHPPEPYRIGSGFRAIVQRCPRPVLAVPEASASVRRALLAYDHSAKAREALFIAAYLAEAHRTGLTVMTVAEAGVDEPEALDHARRYLELHEVAADFVSVPSPAAAAILSAADERDVDLVLMGGYGRHPALGVVLGSAVDAVLGQSRRPVLICR